jgi:hypothetical protein
LEKIDMPRGDSYDPMGSSTDTEVLFSGQTGAANGTAVEWGGGEGVFSVIGTFGGTTAKLQWSPDNGTTWIDVDRSGETFVTFTAAGSGAFVLPRCFVRAVLTGGSPVQINARVAGTGAG